MSAKNESIIQAIKFTAFSISAGVIEFVVSTVLQLLTPDANYYVHYLPALALSVLWNCTFNRKFTFKSAINLPKAMVLALLFYVPFTPLSTIAGESLKNNAHWNETVILILTMIANFALEFLWQKFVVFRDNNSEKQVTKQ